MADDTAEITFDPPGPGEWTIDATHRGRRPLTPFLRGPLEEPMTEGTRVLVQRYGIPLQHVQLGFVNGCLYMRPIAIGEGKKPKPPPPKRIMKLIVRLHPELRRRTRTAKQAWDEKRWRSDVDQWFEHDRAEVVAQNLEFQAIDPAEFDNTKLLAHLGEILHHFVTQAALNMANHGGDLMPVGALLDFCRQRDISFGDAAALLQGSTPATTETARLIAPAAAALARSAQPPASVYDVRCLSPEARDSVDSWLERHGWRLVRSDDIDKPTLMEDPALQLTALLGAATDDGLADETPDPGAVRSQIPPEERATFDELLTEARCGMRQRDDVVGVRWNWSGGLLRRAALEVGRRLVDRGRLECSDHVVELSIEEIEELVVSGSGPSMAAIADRATYRDRVEAANAPDVLGDPEAAPPLDAFPPAMARFTSAMMTAFEAESAAPSEEPLHGTGVGTETYRGRARVVVDSNDAIERLEPGDVLVAPFVGPSYNSLLPILGALVADAGGVLSHAAIVAREYGRPAVIGAAGATSEVPDGALVEVDPTAGAVRIIDRRNAQ